MPSIEEEIKQKAFFNIYHKANINLVYTTGWLQSRQNEIFREHNLTLPQFNILRILRGQHPQPASINLLIERMLDKTSNASRIVDKLEIKGLVTRTPSKHDRRIVDVTIQPAGLELLKKLDEKTNEISDGLNNLTQEEAEELNRLLDKVRS